MRLTRKRRDESGEFERAKRRRDSTLRRLPSTSFVSTTDQDEQRHRRRHWLPVTYTGTFDLTAEVEALLAPLATRPEIARYPRIVERLATAAHEMVLDLGELLAERDARRQGAQGRDRQLLVAARTEPDKPTIDQASIVSGTWASILVDHARPLTEPLAAYLKDALPPGKARGALSISERVEAAVRELDRAALSAQRSLDHAETSRVDAAPPMNARLRHLGATPDELRRLGLTT